MRLLDSDVLIDISRNHPPALSWLGGLGDTPLNIAGFVRFELVQGCRSGEELRRIERVLRPFETVWPSPEAMQNALADFGRLRLSHNVGMIDCMIAHTTLEHEATLFTFNLRHFAHFPGLDARAPYAR